MKGLYILFIFTFILFSNQEFYSQEEPSKAPDIKTFALNPDQIGALANSVNLFTGQVNLPINLISMKGRNGLDVNVSISYSSNVKKNVDTWNLEAPTGVLGLGWQFGYSQIVVDHKGTGTREDDEFYLIEGGASNKLVCYQINSNNRKYKTKNYQFWDITYYNNSSEERWEIVKENGIKYVYGGDLTGNRNTVQYLSKWGNWIGNSNNPTGVSSIVVGWNLSKVQNIWGEEITFAYEVADITLGASKQTEACYLKTITDNFNRQIEFFYGNKLSQEYQEPHTEAVEPDGYQERYEKKYVDSIVVKNTNSLRLFSICFGYGSYGSGNFYKRQLTSVTQKNINFEFLPGLSFTYNSSVDPNSAALKEVNLPIGGKVIYTYINKTIGNSERKLTISSPGSDWVEPRVFIADDYVVVTWRNAPDHVAQGRIINVRVYQWLGEWVEKDLGNIDNIDIVNNYQDFNVSLQNDFFALLTLCLSKYRTNEYSNLYIFTKNKLERGNWNSQVALSLQNIFKAQLVTGNGFVSVLVSQKDWDYYVKDYQAFFTYLSGQWINSTPNAVNGLRTLTPNNYAYGSVNNSIFGGSNFNITHYIRSNPDIIYLDYLDEINNWHQNSYSISENPSANSSYLYGTNTFLALLAGGDSYQNYIYAWDQYYNGLTSFLIGGWPDDSPGFWIGNTAFAHTRNSYDRSFILRFDGNNFISSGEMWHETKNISSNANYCIRRDGNNTAKIKQFKLKDNVWENDITFTSNYSLPIVKMGDDIALIHDKVYRRNNTTGLWDINLGTLTTEGSNFWNYAFRINSTKYVSYMTLDPVNKAYIQPIQNGDLYRSDPENGPNPIVLSGEETFYDWTDNIGVDDHSEFTGQNIIVTYPAGSLPNKTTLNLYYIQDYAITGQQQSYVVSKIEIDDLDSTTTNSITVFHYESPTVNKATIDKTGTIAQFNKVTVIPAGNISDINYHPYGYTVNYFFNELPSSETNKAFPTGTNTNAANNYMLLTGMPYETDVYDNNNVLKSSIKNHWYIFSKDVNTTKCYYTRLLQKDEMLDGITKTTENTYSDYYGVLKSQQIKNYNTNGVEEVLKTEYLYGMEVMPYYVTLQLQNRFTDVVQTKTLNGSTVIGMSATTLKLFNGVWAPHKSYARTVAGSTDFDFYNWSDTGEPLSDWLKTSEITNVDIRGQVVETKDTDGRYTTTHWDRNGLQVASFSNTQNTNKTISENFDDLSFTDGQPASWTGTGGWTINSLGVLSWPTNTESTIPFYSNQQTSSDFIAEFDVRIPSALTTSDWGGFQFRKTSAAASPFTSGYTVFLRKNGRVELYNAYSGTILGYYQLSGTDVASDWQRIRVVASGTTIQVYINGTRRINYSGATSFFGNYTSFYAYRSQAQFDNLVIYPDDAYASMTGYDPKFLLLLKNIDTKGAVLKNVFDSFQKKIGTVGPTNIPISTVQTFLSTDRYGSFNVNDPNSSLSTTVHGNFGLYNDFSTHINNWTVLDNSNGTSSTWTLTDGKLIHTNSGDAINQYCDFLYLDLGTNLTGRIGVEFSVKTDPSCNNIDFGFGLGSSSWTINTSSETNSAVWTRFSNVQTWQIKDGSNWINAANWLKPNRYYRLKAVIDVTNKKVDYFIDGKPLLSNQNFVNSSNSNIRKLAFFNYGYGPSTTWYIDDLMIYTEPSHSIVFTDAIGKTLQTQTEETSSSIICSETLYDALGRGYVQTMPVRLASSWLGYNAGFVTSFDDGTGAIAGTVLTGSVDSYPYSRTVYELSPLSRSIEQGQPGNELRIGNGHTTENSFTKNSSGQFPINYPVGQGFVTRSINADGVSAWEMKDKLGRTLASQTGPVKGSNISDSYIGATEYQTTATFTPNISGTATYYFYNPNGNKSFSVGTSPRSSNILYCESTGSGSFNVSSGTTYYLTISGILESIQSLPSDGESIQSLYSYANVTYKSFVTDVNIYPVSTNEYDIYGNLIKIYQPNYYNIPDPSFDKNKYIINMTYDFNGRLKTKQSSDYDTVRYVYDKAGRLRFSMDGNGESQTTDNIKYIKYDGLGRVSEEGYIVQNWNESTLQNYANTNPSWPTTPATWRKKFTYGSHGSDVFQRGEVTQVQVNNDANLTAEVTETYTYNILGDVTTVSTTTNGINQAISYTYNYDGQVATLNYGTTTVYYGYDRLGRVSTIGTSSDADYYAAYSYANYNGSLYQEKLNNNGVIRTLSYNNHGWLSQINDDNYFKEVITYHSDGYGGAGYYNGNISKILVNDPEQGAGYDYTMAFKYDNLGRMQVADVTDGMGANLNNYDIGFGTGNETKFDANGNLSFLRDGTTNRNYKYFASTNLIKNTNGSSSVYYNHDKNGNVIYSLSPQEWNISYDPYFNLTSALDFEDMGNKFWYGPKNERVMKGNIADLVSNSYEYTYYYHGLNDYPLIEKDYYNTSLQSTKLYIYGPTGLVAIKDGSQNLFVVKDHLGSTRTVLNTSNYPVARYHYSPYGRTMYASVNTDAAYKFTGQEYDDENGLYNFRARMYDAELGMFYAYDPASQGFSPFSYTGNNPIIYVDKDGKFPWLVLVPIGAGLLNAITHTDAIHNVGDFLSFFSVGASAATISIIPGAGYAGVLFGSNFLLYGNSILTGEPVSYEQAIYNLAMTSVFYGMASYAGTGNFFDREFWFPGSTPTLLPQNIPNVNKDAITAPKIQDDLIELPRVTVSADETRTVASRITSLDSELPEIGTVRLIDKTEVKSQLTKKSFIDGYKLSNHAFRKSILGRGISEDIIKSTISGAKSTGNIITEVGTGKFAGNIIRIYQHNGINVIIDETRKSILSIRPLSGFKLP